KDSYCEPGYFKGITLISGAKNQKETKVADQDTNGCYSYYGVNTNVKSNVA
ncbi:MAG: hypothetical protein HW384_600, partial [Dehalococcoidia bacterium]|nr:hypothetical protein [Dehalococcoidia bacterium]